MVKATLPEFQSEVTIAGLAHTTIDMGYRGMGRFRSVTSVQLISTTPISFPELLQMNGRKGRTEYLHASPLCLAENAGLPVPGHLQKVLDGNGATIVPKVHAVMAWAASHRLDVKEV